MGTVNVRKCFSSELEPFEGWSGNSSIIELWVQRNLLSRTVVDLASVISKKKLLLITIEFSSRNNAVVEVDLREENGYYVFPVTTGTVVSGGCAEC
jgi:hypothetical protein